MELQEVRQGLIDRRRFKRRLDGNTGWEYVRPTRYMEFEHIVVGETNGGWGGCAELHVDCLLSGHWAEMGWEED